jgi:hypothetical protein
MHTKLAHQLIDSEKSPLPPELRHLYHYIYQHHQTGHSISCMPLSYFVDVIMVYRLATELSDNPSHKLMYEVWNRSSCLFIHDAVEQTLWYIKNNAL